MTKKNNNGGKLQKDFNHRSIGQKSKPKKCDVKPLSPACFKKRKKSSICKQCDFRNVRKNGKVHTC